MLLEIHLGKRKGNFLPFPPLPHFRPTWPFLSRWPSSPLLPCAPHRPSTTSAQLRVRPARLGNRCRALLLLSSTLAQPLTAWACASAPSPSSRNRSARSKRSRCATTAHVPCRRGSVPYAPASTKGNQDPPRVPLLLPAPFSHSPSTTEAATATPKGAEVRRTPLRVAAVPEPPPSLIFAVVRFAVLSSLSSTFSLGIWWLV